MKVEIVKEKPDWMSESTYYSSTRVDKMRKSIMKCIACKKKFKTKYISLVKKNASYPEFDFYVHYMNKCKKYRKLDLIAECEECPLKYIEKHMLEEHIKQCHCKTGRPSRGCATPTSCPTNLKDAIVRANHVQTPKISQEVADVAPTVARNLEDGRGLNDRHDLGSIVSQGISGVTENDPVVSDDTQDTPNSSVATMVYGFGDEDDAGPTSAKQTKH